MSTICTCFSVPSLFDPLDSGVGDLFYLSFSFKHFYFSFRFTIGYPPFRFLYPLSFSLPCLLGNFRLSPLLSPAILLCSSVVLLLFSSHLTAPPTDTLLTLNNHHINTIFSHLVISIARFHSLLCFPLFSLLFSLLSLLLYPRAALPLLSLLFSPEVPFSHFHFAPPLFHFPSPQHQNRHSITSEPLFCTYLVISTSLFHSLTCYNTITVTL
jgi:hypothetical protein